MTANVEIYKLKKTAPPAVRDYGMFEFFGMVDGPLPQNYVREWAGELNSGNLETLCGRFMLNPPKDYHSGPLEKSDVAVVNGEAYFLDRESGYKFVEVDFDASGVKDAIHVEYGYYVNTSGVAALSRESAAVCAELGIPTGHFSEPDYHGSHKGESSFDPSPIYSYSTAYLHPQFLKGTEAREFIGLLTELTGAERWPEIKECLIESYPVYHQDLEKARELFAPELLLPAELRPYAKAIPADADKSELNYLAAKVGDMDGDQRNVFGAVAETEWCCGSVAELINLTENLDCFELQPALNETVYGGHRLEQDWEECEAVVQRLEDSDDPAERALAKYITLLGRCVEEDAYGYHAAMEEGGVFTSQGLITGKQSLREVYRGVQDIPAEYRVTASSPIAAADAPDISEMETAGKPSVLDRIREAAQAPKEPRKDKPARDKSGPEL